MNSQINFLLNRSLESLRNSNLESAELYLKQALKVDSRNSHVLRLLGVLFIQKHEFEKAIEYLLSSLNSFPKNPLTKSNLGIAYFKIGKYDAAIKAYDEAISIEPKYEEAWLNKGNVLYELKQFYQAITLYEHALSLNQYYADAWSNKGNALVALNLYDEALLSYEKALEINPNDHVILTNKGFTLHELGRFDDAIAHYDSALSLKPGYVEGWSNKGNTLYELGQLHDAITHYDKALSLKPDYYEASWNKGLSLLLQGDFENGLPLYESRWNVQKVSELAGKRCFNKPSWLGVESLAGKTIFLYGEQGLGDFIQFCRYVKLVADLGAKVILETPKSLVSLMKNLEGVSQLSIQGEELPSFDYQCPLLSLPLAFNTNSKSIPSDNAYLISSPEKLMEWRLRLGEKTKKRVGLVWSSTSIFPHDEKRSLPLADFVKALPADGYEYICLQKEIKDCDQEFFMTYKNIQYYGDQLNDFSDTAALIECVDLVVSTCTSVPHLSAAMGKETWILLSYVPDWRWFLDVTDSPWYRSVSLYRQEKLDDWSGALERVRASLENLLKK